MRAFLGAPVQATPALSTLLDDLARAEPTLKVVSAPNLHLTLKFLGDVPADLATRFAQDVRAQPLPAPFDIEIGDVGTFPSWKEPHVLWAGVRDPEGGLTKLFVAAEKSWTALGQPSEGRPFHAHLTLARTRRSEPASPAVTLLRGMKGTVFGPGRVDRAILYESKLTPQGPSYGVVQEIAL